MKQVLKKILRQCFEVGQRVGFDLLPRHFYSEIPDIGELKRTVDWRKAYSMTGVKGTEIESQLALVRDWIEAAKKEGADSKIHDEACQLAGHDGFGVIESDVLYAFIRKVCPQVILQVGCGVSTAVILAALKEAQSKTRLICVEPYPDAYLRELSRVGDIELRSTRAENMIDEMSEILKLGGFLFVDSTHTLRPGGEVPRIVLELLPRLPVGAWVHFHDIYFPFDYGRDLLSESLFFQHESVFVHAFLSGNESYRVAASLSMLHYQASEAMKKLLSRYVPQTNRFGLRDGARQGHFPSSLYLYKEA